MAHNLLKELTEQGLGQRIKRQKLLRRKIVERRDRHGHAGA